MKSNVDETVDRYLSGTMPEEERRAFEQSIEGESDARKLLAADRAIERSFSHASANLGGRTVPNSAILGYLGQTRPVQRNRWVVWSSLVAFLLVVTGLVYLTAVHQSQNSPQAPFSHPQADTIRVALPEAQMDSEETTEPTTAGSTLRSKPPQSLNEKLAPPKLYNADSVTIHIGGK